MADFQDVARRVGHAIGHPSVHALVEARAPGRINLIGEHVDYVGGFVLPAALPMSCRVLFLSRTDAELTPITIVVAGRDATLEVAPIVLPSHPTDAALSEEKAMPTFVTAALIETSLLVESLFGIRGAYRTITNALEVRGAVIYVEGTVPLGAGLSSSAALCVSLIFACLRFACCLEQCSGIEKAWSPPTLVAIAQAARRIENKYCGVQCGIMDQFVSVHAQRGSFLCLDCDTLQCTQHCMAAALGDDYVFVLANSMHTHALGDAYNHIRGNIEAAQKKAGTFLKDDKYLLCRAVAAWVRDPQQAPNPVVTLKQCLEQGILNEAEHRCSSYVAEEMTRTFRFIETVGSIASGCTPRVDGIRKLGALLCETHHGLSQKLRVSTPELDFIQEHLCAGPQPKAIGARLMGGGFGGCCLVLIERSKIEGVATELQAAFVQKFGGVPCEIFVVNELGDGASSRAL